METLDTKSIDCEGTYLEERYGQCTDEELILRLRGGESGIVDYIMNKYKYLVRVKAKSMYILGGDGEDLIQEGMIGLFKAVRDYDAGRDASFQTFADLCISRQMYTAVQASQRKKHWPLNTYISLYEQDKNEPEKEGSVQEPIPGKEELNPETMFIDKERVNYLEERIDKELSKLEKEILDLYMTGMTTSEIAKVLGRDEKSTDNGLQRLKSKIKKML